MEPGDALDAFGGVGLFAGSLLSAGHEVTTVESSGDAIDDGRATREAWPDGRRWSIEAVTLERFLERDGRPFDVVVADPPRAGLGSRAAAELAGRTRKLFLYVSCDPATLARDLSVIRAGGWEIRGTALYDFFAFTHRIEALVVLRRKA